MCLQLLTPSFAPRLATSSFYYFHARSDMSGLMQTSFFYGYMALICWGLFLMLGSVGYRGSLLFVRHIYRSIKCE